MMKISSFHEPGPRYPSLRIVGSVSAVLGAIMLVLGAGALATIGYFALAARDAPSLGPAPMMAAGIYTLWCLGILLSGLQLIAAAAFIRLMIHVEENTRASAQALHRIRSRLEATPEDAEPFFLS